MARPNAIVSTVLRFEPPLDRPPAELLRTARGLSVELADGRLVRLDPADPRSVGLAQVLDEMSKLRLPVYLEIDPASSTITWLRIPLVTRVHGVSAIDDGLSIELERSHARHMLRSENPDFGQMERQLRDALHTRASIIVTENDTPEIIDIRTDTSAPEGPRIPFPQPEVEPRSPLLWRRIRELLVKPRSWFRRISASEAQQIFDTMAASNCSPFAVLAPCIPFLYPDNGCWARAHEMCRLMINLGYSPRKVWISGRLRVSTRNSPSCAVKWSWHVAPTLLVGGPSIFQARVMVIDPALFATPVTMATWTGAQGDPKATLTDTDASIYLQGLTDPTYAETNLDLDYYRRMLRLRSMRPGPPPFANCP